MIGFLIWVAAGFVILFWSGVFCVVVGHAIYDLGHDKDERR
jgi:hypothetical protein